MNHPYLEELVAMFLTSKARDGYIHAPKVVLPPVDFRHGH